MNHPLNVALRGAAAGAAGTTALNVLTYVDMAVRGRPASGPMALLGVTDPRSWPAKSWVADIVPHLACGVVTAAVLDRLDLE